VVYTQWLKWSAKGEVAQLVMGDRATGGRKGDGLEVYFVKF